jgi:hypothetical protein
MRTEGATACPTPGSQVRTDMVRRQGRYGREIVRAVCHLRVPSAPEQPCHVRAASDHEAHLGETSALAVKTLLLCLYSQFPACHANCAASQGGQMFGKYEGGLKAEAPPKRGFNGVM